MKDRGSIGPRRSNPVWTDERVNALLAMQKDGVPWEEIKAAINALPGQPAKTANGVRQKYLELRSASFATPPVGTRGMADGFEATRYEMPVPYEEARAWAVRNGLCHVRYGLNLNAVNEVRAQQRLPVFVLHGAM